MVIQKLVVLLCPRDGFSKAEDMQFFHMPIWLQVHKLSDGYCNKDVVGKLLSKAGKILEMRLNGNMCGDYIHVRVRHDVHEPLTEFVRIA